MEFRFTEEQQALRNAARRFLQSVSTPERVMAVMETPLGYDRELWDRLSQELGWPALTIPERYGGLGMSTLDLHLLMEEMGRHVFCGPFFSTVCLGTNALLVAGTEAHKEEHLPKIAQGSMTATVAHLEKTGRLGADGIEASYERAGDGYVLNGEKYFVIDGHTADLLVVAAREQGSTGLEGVSLFLVPADTKGVTRQWLPTMDQTRRQASLRLEGVRVPGSARMGEEGQGWAALGRTLDLATAALCAEQVGGAEMCLDMSVDYAKVRTQFGRPIGSFQAIKHKCADMLVRVESARSAAFYANAVASEEPKALAEAASSAKAYCSDAYFHCAAENVQIHGGIGFTWEHPAHLYFKRAKSTETLLGNATFHRERVAQLMEL